MVKIAYPPSLVKITLQVHPRNLDSDGLAFVLAFPHVREPATALRSAPPVIGNWDL